jgi:hypothetical protein
MNFNITRQTLQQLHLEKAFGSVKRLDELSEPSGFSESPGFEIHNVHQIKQSLGSVFGRGKEGWRSSNTGWGQLDAEAAVILHTTFRHLPMQIATSKGFWRYLSAYCAESVAKRYGYTDVYDDFDEKHFGEEIFDSILPRLWFRAELSIDESNSEDPYWLTKKGLSDFWTSFVLRKIYAQSKPLVRALVRYFFEDESISFSRAGSRITTLEAFRDIGKLVRKQHSLTPFELLAEDKCLSVINLLGSELGIERSVIETKS